jgi:hypothetical protein
MSEYETTREQDEVLRDWLQESIVPLIEQVLVKKIGQAMQYAAEELIQPKCEWQGLTDDEVDALWIPCSIIQAKDRQRQAFAKAIEAKLKEKNT